MQIAHAQFGTFFFVSSAKIRQIIDRQFNTYLIILSNSKCKQRRLERFWESWSFYLFKCSDLSADYWDYALNKQARRSVFPSKQNASKIYKTTEIQGKCSSQVITIAKTEKSQLWKNQKRKISASLRAYVCKISSLLKGRKISIENYSVFNESFYSFAKLSRILFWYCPRS